MCPDKLYPKGEDLLRDLDQLQARQVLSDIEPPAMIDQAVRNMARRAVQNQAYQKVQRQVLGQRSPLAGKLGWIAGLATTSIAVIALGISLVQAPATPNLADPAFKAKKEESHLQAEKTNDALQSAASVRAESADQPARAVDRSASLEVMKQAAEAMVSPPQTSLITSSAESPAESADLARLSEEVFADSADNLQQADNDSAQAWLDLIQQLHDQGLTIEATEQLYAFAQDHPDYPLPGWALALQQAEQ
ncbi:MAG: hypothetical protein SH820_13415 [Xanthomonadales bacterium]|nr:hypothetical protein [Xanthomonadales bacterium]